MKLILNICLILLVSNLVTSIELPDYITVCHTSDPKYNDCVIKSIENIRLKLNKGISELDIPPLDPMTISDLRVFDKNKNNGFQVDLKNVVVNGAGDFKINKLTSFDNGKKYNADISLPQLLVNGQYTITGRILLLPLNGDGNFKGNFTNYDANIKIIGSIEDDKGVERYTIKKLILKIKVGDGSVILDNILNGDKAITDAINQTINDSYKELAQELNAPIEKALANRFKEIGNKLLSHLTYKQLFPV